MTPWGSGQGVALEPRGRIKIGSILIMVGKLTPETVSVVKCLRSSISMNYLDYEQEWSQNLDIM